MKSVAERQSVRLLVRWQGPMSLRDSGAGERSVWLEGFLEAPEIPNNPYYRMFDLIASGFSFTGTSLSAIP